MEPIPTLILSNIRIVLTLIRGVIIIPTSPEQIDAHIKYYASNQIIK
jgi:hypothetical protein